MARNLYHKINWQGGVNLLRDPSAIREDQVAYAKNLFPNRSGVLSKRGGLNVVAQLASGDQALNAIAPTFESAIESVMATRSIQFTQHSVEAVSGNSVVASGFFGGMPVRTPCLVSYLNKIYAFGGHTSSKSGLVVSATGGVVSISDFVFAGTNNVFGPAGACVYRDRMVFWDLGPGYENYIVFSDRYSPTAIGNDVRAANGMGIAVGPVDGDRIVACAEVTLTAVGSPAQSALLILKERSGFLMTGEPSTVAQVGAGSSVLGSAVINRYSFNVGCSSLETMQWTPHGLIWTGPDDVWLFQSGQIPIPIGKHMAPALAHTPANLRYRWHSGYHNGIYRLAIFSEGQGPDDDSPCGEQWWLDLRDGAPQNADQARWWGPQIFKVNNGNNATAIAGTRTMFRDTRPGRADALYGIEIETNRVLVGYDQTAGYDLTDSARIVDPNNLKNVIGNEITVELRTRETDFGDAAVNKILSGAELQTYVGQPTQFQLVTRADGGRADDTATKIVSQAGDILSFNLIDEQAMTNEVQAVALRESATRFLGKRFQFILSDLYKWVVDGTNNFLAFNVDGSLVSGGGATVASGAYSSIVTYLDALVAAMSALTGRTFTHNQGGSRPRNVEITINSGTWAPVISSGALTANQQARSRKTLSLLGYDLDATYSAASAHYAPNNSPALAPCDAVDLYGLTVVIRPISRRP